MISGHSKYWILAMIAALAVLWAGGQDDAEASHGSEFHVTNAHMRDGGTSDWYQGGYADCAAYHNVCWFQLSWYYWNNGWYFVGYNTHSIPAGPANWHSSTAGCPYRFLGGSECWVWDHHDNSYETPPSHAVSPRFTGCKNWNADVTAVNYTGDWLDYDTVYTYTYGCVQ